MVHRYDLECFKIDKICKKGLTQLMPFLKITNEILENLKYLLKIDNSERTKSVSETIFSRKSTGDARGREPAYAHAVRREVAYGGTSRFVCVPSVPSPRLRAPPRGGFQRCTERSGGGGHRRRHLGCRHHLDCHHPRRRKAEWALP